jgi:hypothetical protein
MYIQTQIYVLVRTHMHVQDISLHTHTHTHTNRTLHGGAHHVLQKTTPEPIHTHNNTHMCLQTYKRTYTCSYLRTHMYLPKQDLIHIYTDTHTHTNSTLHGSAHHILQKTTPEPTPKETHDTKIKLKSTKTHILKPIYTSKTSTKTHTLTQMNISRQICVYPAWWCPSCSAEDDAQTHTGSCPHWKDKTVTAAHSCFAYSALAYGMTQVYYSVVSTEFSQAHHRICT